MTAKPQGIIPIAALAANGNLESLKSAVRVGLDAGLSIISRLLIN